MTQSDMVELRLDGLPDERRRVASVEMVDCNDAGGRGDVDLGQIAGNHIDSDEKQSAPRQLGTERLTNLQLARRELGRCCAPAGGEIGSYFPFARQAVDGSGRLAV